MSDKQMAFPCAGNPHEDQMIFGMELRDWFAGMALQGRLANSTMTQGYDTEENYARYAYEMADEMMKARGAK